jgi:hypothetical protein
VTGYHPSVTGAVAGIKTEIKTPSLRICEEFADDAAGGFRTRPAIPGNPFDGTSASPAGYLTSD